MVLGFITSMKGHIIVNKFVVLAKVRHWQRMNDSLIRIWIITEEKGTILSAHCLGRQAGVAESCSHIASVLFYVKVWAKINGKLACMQVKCSWLLPSFVDHVEYARARDINFTSANKMKADLSPIYTTGNFWHSSDKNGTRTKNYSTDVLFTRPFFCRAKRREKMFWYG